MAWAGASIGASDSNAMQLNCAFGLLCFGRALEIYMLSAPEPRPAGDGAVGRDLRGEVAASEGRPADRGAEAPTLLGGPV